jgi:hypothetical protein
MNWTVAVVKTIATEDTKEALTNLCLRDTSCPASFTIYSAGALYFSRNPSYLILNARLLYA